MPTVLVGLVAIDTKLLKMGNVLPPNVLISHKFGRADCLLKQILILSICFNKYVVVLLCFFLLCLEPKL